MKTLKSIKNEMLADPETKAAYEAMSAEFDMARELIAARSKAGITQSELAQRMGTTQSVIARLEGGDCTPSMRTIQRYAKALGCRAVVRIEHA